ncbi:Type 1 glutamine amidotransferase-like domain-containing protein [Filobacillus milosensis]|uniref:Type 1 glutamine amidotransferase-like domain-containing protein n=1 Tax=Filobacillus milosensis TaxID=94137 RepID=UPI0018918477|nr:Type 1 glutamine amidotransferase-like domain-containing protein [Filobacillus milosensis]
MGKLYFYSDQVIESPGNKRLDQLLLAGFEAKDIKIGYIPSTEDKDKEYFNTKVQYYKSYGIHNMMFFDLCSEFDSMRIKELMECDIIHLSAGNPIEFRHAIKNRQMDRVLRDYFNNGGTIVGVSGGAVQLGKTTNLFQLFTGKINDEASDTLNFVDFEFLPHYNRWSDEFKQKVQKYAQETGTKIYAGNDGDGLIVDGDQLHMVGDIVVISENAFI